MKDFCFDLKKKKQPVFFTVWEKIDTTLFFFFGKRKSAKIIRNILKMSVERKSGFSTCRGGENIINEEREKKSKCSVKYLNNVLVPDGVTSPLPIFELRLIL